MVLQVEMGENYAKIMKAYNMFDFNTDYSQKFYGDGHASEAIYDVLSQIQ